MKPLRLTDNTFYTDWQYKPKPDKFLKELSACTIEELNSNTTENGEILVWPHSFKECKDDLANMTILNLEYQKDGKVKSMRTNNLVGFVGNGDVQLEINSRFSTIANNKKAEIQDYFLYYMLSKVFSINIVNMEVCAGSLKDLDLLIFVFPRLLKEAMRQGMFKHYIKKEYNDANLRGTIDINKHIRLNYPANGRISYRTREFSYDNDITQLVRHTIEYLNNSPIGQALLNSDKEIEQCVRMTIQATPTYQKGNRHRIINANKKPLSHPYYTRYKELQRLCLAILRNEKISHGVQKKKIHGVLIDIAWLWEEYIGVILKDINFSHHTMKNSFKLFKNTENNKQFQTIIPDYVGETSNGRKIVADAKYIPLHLYDKFDAGRASDVYYKTIMYMYRFATNIGFLLHPCERNETNTTFSDYEIDNDKRCHLYEVGLVIPENNSYFKKEIVKNEKEFIECINKYALIEEVSA